MDGERRELSAKINSGDYDSRFEENYKQGYEAGWQGISY